LVTATQLSPGGVDAPWASIAIADDHACAIRADDGLVYCWGMDDIEQLGTTDLQPRAAADAQVMNGAVFDDVAVNTFVTCGATDEHVLACWGADAATTMGIQPYYAVDDPG